MQRRLSLAIPALSLAIGLAVAHGRACAAEPETHGATRAGYATFWDKWRILCARLKAHLDPSLDSPPPPICPREPEIPKLAKWAHPSDTGRYSGGWVGGGCPFGRTINWPRRHPETKAGPPAADEGTWGWDFWGHCYLGCHVRRYPFLDWWRDGHYQGGTGAYRGDGPTAFTGSIILSEPKEEEHEEHHGEKHKDHKEDHSKKHE